MKFKLDENLSRAAAAVLREAAFDVVTVSDQGLEGARDPDLIGCCVREERCLRTLRDALLASGSPPGSSIPLPGPDRHLWVVQPGRVRLYQGDDE